MHSAHKSNIVLIFAILLTVVFGCREKPTHKKYAAKVGNTYLMRNVVDKALVKPENMTKHREEFVRDWVETEMLYKEAVKQGIVNDSAYKSIVKNLKKELAGAMLLQKVGNDNFKINKTELTDFFNLNKNDFKISDNAVVINYIKFDNEQSAIKYRNMLINSSWQNAINIFEKDTAVIDFRSNKYLHYYEISPPILLRYIKNLNPGEIGIVLKTEPNVYVVVQIKAFFKKGDIPGFAFIKDRIKERYLMIKKKKSLRNYINKLYSKYDVEIKKGN